MAGRHDDDDSKSLESFSSTCPTEFLDEEAGSYSSRRSSNVSRVTSNDDPFSSFSQSGSSEGRSWRRCLGVATIALLVITIPLNLSILGFIAFLWHGGPGVQFWHTIMVRNWSTRAVTVPILTLRTCGEMQACAATAMIAALVLEGSSIPIRSAARWSMARASKPRPRTLLVPIFQKTGSALDVPKVIYRVAVLLLCLTVTLLQFATTILFTDYGLGPVPGQSHNDTVRYNLVYPSAGTDYVDPSGWAIENLSEEHYPIPNRVSTWRRNPPAYPTFAEYSKPAVDRAGVDDTGVLLRAFLPFSEAALRQSVRNYTGKAAVLDSRVSCQAPLFTDLTAQESMGMSAFSSGNYTAERSFIPVQINGTLSPSERNAGRLWTPNFGVPFSCIVGIGADSTSICQLSLPPTPDVYAMDVPLWNQAGGVLSQFSNLTDPSEIERVERARVAVEGYSLPAFITWGTPLLVLRTVESGPLNLKQDHVQSEATLGSRGQILHPTSSRLENEWSSMISEDVSWHPWKVSASLCYTAWDMATLDVEISSDSNLTEPVAYWDKEGRFYTMSNITQQLLGSLDSNLGFADRHVLELKEKDSWIPAPEDAGPISAMPFVQACADVSGTSLAPHASMPGNWTTLLYDDFFAKPLYTSLQTELQSISADSTLVSLFNGFMDSSNGSVAQSLSAMITVLSGMAYYDLLPLFQMEANTAQTFFTDVLYAQRVTGFWIVVVLVLAHTLLVVGVTAAFLSHSRVSFLGSYWHAAVQLFSEETQDVFMTSSMHTDKELKRKLNCSLGRGCTAQLAVAGQQESVSVRVDCNQWKRSSIDTQSDCGSIDNQTDRSSVDTKRIDVSFESKR